MLVAALAFLLKQRAEQRLILRLWAPAVALAFPYALEFVIEAVAWRDSRVADAAYSDAAAT
jgi:hypothetical protein